MPSKGPRVRRGAWSAIQFRLQLFQAASRVLGFREALFFWLFVRIGPRFWRPTLRVSLPEIPKGVWIRASTTDARTFEKVFVVEEYSFPVHTDVSRILDCGGNIGFSAIWFATHFPRSTIAVVEAESQNYRLLTRNLETFPAIQTRHLAVWHTDTTLYLQNPLGDTDSFQVASTADGDPAGKVNAKSIPSLLAELGWPSVDLLKLDIEHAELEVLTEGDLTWLDKVKILVVEFHGDDVRERCARSLPGECWQHSRVGENDIFTRIGSETAATG